jgi:spermidine synthase
MYCQNQLIVHKPKSSRSLAFFYVVISFGSFLGGFLTSWIIPLVSLNTVEYLVGLLLIAAVRIFDKKDKKLVGWPLAAGIAWVVFLAVWPKIFPHYSLIGVVVLVLAVWFISKMLAPSRFGFVITLAVITLASAQLEIVYKRHGYIHKHRNYYGIYEIYDGTQLRTFIHGTTLHGVQLREGPLKQVPIGYYSPMSAVGELMIENQEKFKRVALIGLGAGSLAGYGNPRQSYDFYELDPDVYQMAKKYFTYIDGSPSNNRYIFGDARLSLEKNAQELYDAIIVDAFGGDSIPVHLVTRDVIEKYRHRLNENGLIIFHATNRYLGIEPILGKVGQALGAYVCYKDTPDGGLNLRSIWVVMTWDAKQFEHLMRDKGWKVFDPARVAGYPVWTDQYSSILPIFKIDMLVGALKAFKFWTL